MTFLSLFFLGIEITTVLAIGYSALRYFRYRQLRPDARLWWAFIALAMLVGILAKPLGALLAWHPHWFGACLAYWLFGFSAGLTAMLVVEVLLTLALALAGALIWDRTIFTTMIHALFFGLILPLILLSIWRMLCQQATLRLKKYFQPTAANPPLTPFDTMHLPHRLHHRSITDYFAHFFGMVFVGSGIAIALSLALRLMIFPPPIVVDNPLLTFAIAILLGYSEAFITGLIYAGVRNFNPSAVYPFSDYQNGTQ